MTRSFQRALVASRRLLRRATRNEDGAAALEFALVGLPFFALVFVIIEMSLHAFIMSALDLSVVRSSRAMLIGAFQRGGGDLVLLRKEICKGLPIGIGCDSLVVDVRPVTDWGEVGSYNVNGKGMWTEPLYGVSLDQSKNKFCPGKPGQIVLVRARFIIPVVTNFLVSDKVVHKGQSVHVASSNHLFRTEPFLNINSASYKGC